MWLGSRVYNLEAHVEVSTLQGVELSQVCWLEFAGTGVSRVRSMHMMDGVNIDTQPGILP